MQAIANTLVHMALVALAQSVYGQARLLSDESLVLQREIGDRRGLLNSLANLGFAHLYHEDWNAASSAWCESLSLSLALEMTIHRLDVLVGIATQWFKLARYEAVAHMAGLKRIRPPAQIQKPSIFYLC